MCRMALIIDRHGNNDSYAHNNVLKALRYWSKNNSQDDGSVSRKKRYKERNVLLYEAMEIKNLKN